MFDWKSLSDAELERHFNPRVAVPDAGEQIARFGELAAAARKRLDMRRGIAYGPHPRECFDLFPGPFGGPLHIFIHGGYWRALSKDEHSFVAEPLVGAGATVAVLNYPLCPEVTLDGLTGSVMRGIAHIARNAKALGASEDGVHLSGHSAGAHLSAVAANHDWTGDGLPADLVRSAALLSGIFEPAAPMRLGINAEIGLTPEIAARQDLMRPERAPRPGCDVLVTVGGDEPEGWIAQTTGYVALHGIRRPPMLVPGTNHFTLLDALSDPKSDLTRTMLEMMGL
ncbi:MAG: alpha/beta hydrolase [Pseudomonadota bacterium]|nr:alpha/beta hydrolase [Pseudomonadota bacterium]